MNISVFKNSTSGQTAIEYLLIITVVAILVLLSFNNLLPSVQKSQDPTFSPDGFFTKVDRVILGETPPKKVDGGWCPVSCPTSGYGPPAIYRTCECPAPAFGGAYCSGSNKVTCSGVTMPPTPPGGKPII